VYTTAGAKQDEVRKMVCKLVKIMHEEKDLLNGQDA